LDAAAAWYPNGVPTTREIAPAADQLWLSRPPHATLVRVRSVDTANRPASIEYELLDEDGYPLTPALSTVLDSGWWTAFQPLVRRQG
jgi:hypothetical protein